LGLPGSLILEGFLDDYRSLRIGKVRFTFIGRLPYAVDKYVAISLYSPVLGIRKPVGSPVNNANAAIMI